MKGYFGASTFSSVWEQYRLLSVNRVLLNAAVKYNFQTGFHLPSYLFSCSGCVTKALLPIWTNAATKITKQLHVSRYGDNNNWTWIGFCLCHHINTRRLLQWESYEKYEMSPLKKMQTFWERSLKGVLRMTVYTYHVWSMLASTGLCI